MSASWFSVEGASSLNVVPPGGRIHVVGVCGVAMAQLAVELAEQGYRVSGSDRQFYEPMGSVLRESAVETLEGYAAGHVPPDASLVVIANAMFADNPEVLAVAERRLPYSSFPQVLGDRVIGDRHAIVACGTHGKSTTSGLLAAMLRRLGEDPSWFVGGVCEDLPRSLHVGAGRFAVVEGDEYHSAFYARVPKFVFYKSRTAVLNAVEFDHADVYPTLEDVVAAFRGLIDGLPADGRLVACLDYPLIRRLIDESAATRRCPVVGFGVAPDAAYRVVARRQEGRLQELTLATPSHGTVTLRVPLIGAYNALNVAATVAALAENGFDPASLAPHLAAFRSVKRRQQVRVAQGPVILVEDFAHHPTAVAGTVRAVREAWPDRRLWAVFEPRSNTSRRKVFEEAYLTAFEGADEVVLADAGGGESRMNAGVELIDVTELASHIALRGTPARTLAGADAIEGHLLEHLGDHDVVVLMSNGAFGGLPARLEKLLSERV